jgi:hypothetical protein
MQRLKVSGAVRPLKWPLGVKWLNEVQCFWRCDIFDSIPEKKNRFCRNRTDGQKTDVRI